MCFFWKKSSRAVHTVYLKRAELFPPNPSDEEGDQAAKGSTFVLFGEPFELKARTFSKTFAFVL